jgi:hypothetical protein
MNLPRTLTDKQKCRLHWIRNAEDRLKKVEEGAMRNFNKMPICLVFVLLGLPSAGLAGEARNAADQPTVMQGGTQAHGGAIPKSPAAKEKSVKKSNQGDVQSRGLFKKKKKKQKSGAAGHSQQAEQADTGGR